MKQNVDVVRIRENSIQLNGWVIGKTPESVPEFQVTDGKGNPMEFRYVATRRDEVSQIYYVEIQGHMLHYYTEEGEFVMRGTLSSVEKMLPCSLFVKCNHWYLVNLMHVTEVRKNTTVVGNFELEVSRRNRAGFLKALAEHMGGNA